MRLDKSKTRLAMLKDTENFDDDYVDATMEERVLMVWDMTLELWLIANKGITSAEPRLQRYVAKLSKGCCKETKKAVE